MTQPVQRRDLNQVLNDHDTRILAIEREHQFSQFDITFPPQQWFMQNMIYGPALFAFCVTGLGADWVHTAAGATGCPSESFLETNTADDVFYFPVVCGGDGCGSVSIYMSLGLTADGGKAKVGVAQSTCSAPSTLTYDESPDPSYNIEFVPGTGFGAAAWNLNPISIGSITCDPDLEPGAVGGPDVYWLRVRMTSLGSHGTRGRVRGIYLRGGTDVPVSI